MGGVAAVRWAAQIASPSSASRRGQKGTAAAGAPERERVGAALVIGVDPTHYSVGPSARAHGHLGGAAVLGDVEQSKCPLARAGMRRIQGQVAQVLRGLTPARVINTDHET